MKTKVIKIGVVHIIILLLSISNGSAWDNEVTHKLLSLIASQNSVIGPQYNYLDKLGLKEGMDEKFKLNKITLKVKDWLQQGADLEDAGNKVDLLLGRARSYNHFHDPLKQWDQAGLNDLYTVPNPYPPFIPLVYPMSGESALVWAQDPTYQKQYIKLEGDQSWQTTRNHYYTAFTSKTDIDRQAEFAQTFKGLGHQMHLLQDMAVPAHVRNDAHVGEAIDDWRVKKNRPPVDLYFETWAKKNVDTIKVFASMPAFPQVDLTKNTNGKIPITQFYDTDQYSESFMPSTSLTWGLAEYSNANFLSDDTIFTEQFNKNDRHYFPYPRYTGYTQCYEQYEEPYFPTNKMRKYWRKKAEGCAGEAVNHFVQVGPWFNWAPTWDKQRWAINLDEATHKDYAEKLVPRAVGYSAGLLNYFFRGDIRLEYTLSPEPGYVIRNHTNEDLSGLFQIMYDKKVVETDKSQDVRLMFMNGTFGLKANGSSAVFQINPPDKPREPGKYILVFRGQMGNEQNAVAGYVYAGRGLEILPPDEYVYGIIDGGVEPQQFVRLKAKLRNSSSDEIKVGTLQAIASYRKRENYKSDLSAEPPYFNDRGKEVSESVSAVQQVSGLSASESKEFVFDFSSKPIPAGITDLYLDVIYKGQIGSDAQAMAVVRKDIDEPHHMLLYNLTDRYEINGVLYSKDEILASPNLMAFLNDLGRSDFYPHPLSMALFFSGTRGKYSPSPAAAIEDLPAARYGRVIFLVDEPNTFYFRNILFDDNMEEQYDNTMTGVVDQLDGDIWDYTWAWLFREAWSHTFWGYWNNACFPKKLCLGAIEGDWPVPEDLTPYPVLINAQ